MIAAFHLELPIEVVVLGLITGLTYALLGVGLVLTYRSSRVINFAHGQLGSLTATVMAILVIKQGWGYAPALIAGLIVAALAGAFTEVVVVRRLAKASRLVALVATIGLAQLFFAIEALIPKGTVGSALFPTPFRAVLTVGSLRLNSGSILVLIVVPIVTVGLALFLSRTRIGLWARASAENEPAARLAGIRVRDVSLAIWVLAGLLAGLSGILLGPTHPVITNAPIGAALLLRALAAAMVGGLSDLRWVFAGGVGIGVLEATVAYNYPTGGTLELVLLAVILLSLLGRRGMGAAVRGREGSTWSLVGVTPRMRTPIGSSRGGRMLRLAGPPAALAVAILVALPMSNAQRVLMASIAVFAIMGLSLVVLTGYAGQVSLGQFAFVGLGALVGGRLGQLGYPPIVAALYATLAGGFVAVLVGLPALRIRGLFLAVSTLAFAVAAPVWLYGRPWLVHLTGTSSSLAIERPRLGSVNFGDALTFYWVCLAVLVIVAAAVRHLPRTGVGRSMIAVRDNEVAAAAMGVSPRRAKLTAFVVAGMLAALAGYLYGMLLGNFNDTQTFAPDYSLTLVAIVVLGGITSATGAILGSALVLGVSYVIAPHLTQLFGGQVALLVSGVGLLGAVLQFPMGLAGAAFALRDRVLDRLAARGRREVAEPEVLPAPRLEPPAAGVSVSSNGAGALEARDIVASFGGNQVVRGVSLDVKPGEIVGLVGPNGAGKTTLFDVLSGQRDPDGGRVLLFGEDVTWLRSERRARLGLGRSFQQATLFESLTLLDAVKVSLECRAPSEEVPSLLALPPSLVSERAKERRARELVELFGLAPYADKRVEELSTGMRRLVEMACVTGVDARLLLLDEPTAGIAQREVEAFGPLLRSLRDALDASILVIEHDVPLMMRLADRIYVMAAGEVIASGTPQEIRDDPKVIAAYLGTDERLIARSGAIVTRRRSARRRHSVIVEEGSS